MGNFTLHCQMLLIHLSIAALLTFLHLDVLQLLLTNVNLPLLHKRNNQRLRMQFQSHVWFAPGAAGMKALHYQALGMKASVSGLTNA